MKLWHTATFLQLGVGLHIWMDRWIRRHVCHEVTLLGKPGFLSSIWNTALLGCEYDGVYTDVLKDVGTSF